MKSARSRVVQQHPTQKEHAGQSAGLAAVGAHEGLPGLRFWNSVDVELPYPVLLGVAYLYGREHPLTLPSPPGLGERIRRGGRFRSILFRDD